MSPQSDLPPPYSALDFPAPAINIVFVEEAPPEYDAEDGRSLLDRGHVFADKTTRIAFIQKVLAIKLFQLFGMCGVMALFVVNHREIIWFMARKDNLVYLMVMSNVLFMVIFGLLVSCGRLRRTSPARHVFLVAHPLTFALYLSVWTVYWHLLTPILLCFAYYCVVVFVLLLYSIFACHTSLDFHTRSGVCIAVGLQIAMYCLSVPFLDIEPIHVLCAAVPMLVEYVYLLCDLEEMTSETYWHDMKPSDFIDGAINLHIDYFNFLYNYTCPCICNAFRRCFEIFKGVERDEALVLMR